MRAKLLAFAVGVAVASPASAWAGIASPAVSQTPPAGDQANAVVSGQFTATGQSGLFMAWGPFNVTIGGASGPNGSWTATVELERSFDGGTTWFVRSSDAIGTQSVWNTPDKDVSIVVGEPEKGVLYRLNCTAYTSGTINYRFSTTGTSAATFAP